jgi:tetratricopeptide (TPR) repeat protein
MSGFKKILLLFVFSNCLLHTAGAQQKEALDSLWRQYTQSKTDKNRVMQLIAVGLQNRFSASDSAAILLKKAIKKATDLQYDSGLIYGHAALGLCYTTMAQYQKSNEHFTKAIETAEKHKLSWDIAANYTNMGNNFNAMGKFNLAIEMFRKSLAINSKLGNLGVMADNYNNIGIVYYYMGDTDKAGEYYLKSLALSEKLPPDIGMVSSLNNVGDFYNAKGSYAKALQYFLRALQLQSVVTGNDKLTATLYNNLGEAYVNLKIYDTAAAWFIKSLELANAINDRRIKVWVGHGLADLYLKTGELKKAEDAAQTALKAVTASNMHREMSMLQYKLYQIYKSSNNSNAAVFYLKQSKAISDSMVKIDRERIAATLEKEYEIEQKEKAIALLARQNELSRLSVQMQQQQLAIALSKTEAHKLMNLARHESEKRKTDSLNNIAITNRLQAQQLGISEEKMRLKNIVATLQIKQMEKNASFRKAVGYTFAGVVAVLIATAFLFKINSNKEKKAIENIALQKKQIELLNQQLEVSVEKRTQDLKERTRQLEDYAYLNTFIFKQPITDIQKLIHSYNTATAADGNTTAILQALETSIKELDLVLRQAQKAVEEKA